MAPSDKAHQLERRARAIVESLQGTWRQGKGMCCCPAHNDRTLTSLKAGHLAPWCKTPGTHPQLLAKNSFEHAGAINVSVNGTRNRSPRH